MIKKISLIVLASAVLLSFSGCNSRGRVHDKNYLRALSVSDGDGEKTVEFSFFSDEVITASGKTIDEAQEKAELFCGREIFTGYTELIVLNGCDCGEILKTMLNDKKVSPDCIVACTKTEKLLSECSPEILCSSVKIAVKHGESPECDIVSVLSGLYGDGKSAETAEISRKGFCGVYNLTLA